jgi:HrpA-like RNA helicase
LFAPQPEQPLQKFYLFQIPQYILDDLIESRDGSRAKVLVTQPRRISAVTVAERVAKERGEVQISGAFVVWRTI